MLTPDVLLDLRDRMQGKIDQHESEMIGVHHDAEDGDAFEHPIEIAPNDLRMLMTLLGRALAKGANPKSGPS